MNEHAADAGDVLKHLLLAPAGAMTVVFAAALSLTAYRFHAFFGKALKLQVELEDRTRELYSSNARLQAEMAEGNTTIYHSS